jgi:hypothetical protein
MVSTRFCTWRSSCPLARVYSAPVIVPLRRRSSKMRHHGRKEETSTPDPMAPAPIETDLAQTAPRGNFLHYPTSRLGAKIIPQDLTNFKSCGVSRVERDLQQELIELREKYLRVIDSFNWNKIICEAHFGFEPVIGELYHLAARKSRR